MRRKRFRTTAPPRAASVHTGAHGLAAPPAGRNAQVDNDKVQTRRAQGQFAVHTDDTDAEGS